MPGRHHFWLDDGQRRAPVMPEAGQADPQQAAGGGQFQTFCRSSPKHTELVTQSQVLEVEGSPRLEDRANRRKECREKNEHERELKRMCNPLSAQIFRHFREAQSSIWPISLLVADSRSAFDSAAHIYGGEATNFTLPAAIPAYSLVYLGPDLVLARLTFNGIFSECFIPPTIDTSKHDNAPVVLCIRHN